MAVAVAPKPESGNLVRRGGGLGWVLGGGVLTLPVGMMLLSGLSSFGACILKLGASLAEFSDALGMTRGVLIALPAAD